jgi:hypothetical protein
MKPQPSPDAYDPGLLPFFLPAGDNKFGFTTCSTCHKPPTILTNPRLSNIAPNGAFMFRNAPSAKEYKISAMCQACQDSVFGID